MDKQFERWIEEYLKNARGMTLEEAKGQPHMKKELEILEEYGQASAWKPMYVMEHTERQQILSELHANTGNSWEDHDGYESEDEYWETLINEGWLWIGDKGSILFMD